MPQFDFEKEFLRVYPFIDKFSCKYRPSLRESEREDLLQETALKILEKRDYFKIEGEYDFNKFKWWCATIMNNIFINGYRLQKMQANDSYDESPFLLFDNEPLSLSVEEEYLLKELRRIITTVEEDPVNRKIFLGYANGMPYEALSEIFDLPLGTLKARLFHIREKLKRVVLKYGRFNS